MRFLVFKGWQGLGDRLSVLSMILEYAIAFKAEGLCIDWRDPIWSGGDPTLDFATVFELRDFPVPLMTIDEIAERVRTEGLRIHPAEVSLDQLLAPPSLESFRWPPAIELAPVTMMPLDPPEGADVLVHVANHLRLWSSKVLRKNLRIRADFAAEWVIPLMREVPTPFTAVHLRGTDHTRDLAYAREEFERLPKAARVRIRVFADDPDLYAGWMEIFGKRCKPAIADSHTRRLPAVRGKGSHNFTDDELRAIGSSKRRLTGELLAELLLISEAKLGMTTATNSMFFRIARATRNLTKDWIPEFSLEVREYTPEERAAAAEADAASVAAASAAAASSTDSLMMIPPWRRESVRERGTFTYSLEEREAMELSSPFS